MNKIICFDSDGTLMDTMTFKHNDVFAPTFLEVFNIKCHHKEIIEKWNYDNLYSSTRGINRFHGLRKILSFVRDTYNISFEGFEKFEEWEKNTLSRSNDYLRQYIKENANNTCLELALKWSELSNVRINKKLDSKSFCNVKDILNVIYKDCILFGVSSAVKDTVIDEWKRNNIDHFFQDLMCQESGNKGDIIKKISTDYPKYEMIMIGDALGDYKAAKKNNIWFFPIIPKYEIESFERFINEIYPIFLGGQMNDKLQKKLLDDFISFLPENK